MIKIIHELSCKITKALCNAQNIVDKNKYEEIAYGIEIIISYSLSILCALFGAIYFNLFKESGVFLITFTLLRRYTGGFHAETHFGCFVIFMIDIIAGAIIMYYIKQMYICSIIMIAISDIIILIYSPVIHKNHPLSKRQKRHNRIKSLQIMIVFSIIGIILILIKQQRLLFSMSYGMASIAISIIIVKLNIRRWKNEV